MISKGRRQLDLAATVLMGVAAVALLGLAIPSYTSRPQQRGVELPVPAHDLLLEGAAVEGCDSSPVAVVIYSDFQCPACGVFAREVLPLLKKRYLDNCAVRFAFRNLPVSAMHPFAVLAAEAAGREGRNG